MTMEIAEPSEVPYLMEFRDPDQRIVFQITADREFILAPDISEQGAAKRFADYVNQNLKG